ncbi:MAG: hypothetical protein NVSMB29_13910 [Candidatus Dormibacteria bacterium]
MCRSIRTLRGAEPPATEADLEAAALQFVRKLSGYRQPSAANREVFEHAVADVATAAGRLLEGLRPPGSRGSHAAGVAAPSRG